MPALARVRRGVPAGGQFTGTTHAEPSATLTGFASPLPYPCGSRVKFRGQLGRVKTSPDARGTIEVTLDDGWTARTKAHEVVPWDAYLASEMPAIAHNPYPDEESVDPARADRLFRSSMIAMRNGLDSWRTLGSSYSRGQAQGHAEVAAALLNADADPEEISDSAMGLLDTDAEQLVPAKLRERHTTPLSALRARQLAGFYTRRAVELQQTLASKPGSAWTALDQDANGRLNSYVKAAVVFSDQLQEVGSAQGRYLTYEDRVHRLLSEGETNVDTIIGEAWDSQAW